MLCQNSLLCGVGLSLTLILRHEISKSDAWEFEIRHLTGLSDLFRFKILLSLFFLWDHCFLIIFASFVPYSDA